MGVYYEDIPPTLQEWIPKQKMFWVATAPLSSTGHINVSPKGGQYFGLIDNKTFWYNDISGSGSETIAHLYEPGNARIVIMFSEFVGAPRIVRLWGHGRVLERGTSAYDRIVAEQNIKTLAGTRSIIVVDVHQVGSSCGWSVPYYEFKDFRPTLNRFYEKKAEKFAAGNPEESMERYWALKNSWSVDLLPASKTGQETMKSVGITPLTKFVGPNAPRGYDRNGFTLLHLWLTAIVCLALGALMATFGPAVSRGSMPTPLRDLTLRLCERVS